MAVPGEVLVEWTTFRTADGTTTGWETGHPEGLVLLLHGGPGMSDYSESFAQEVADALPGRHVVRYQQRGLDPSATTGPFTVAQLVEDLFGVVDHSGVDQVVLVGHSWGGHLAMHAAVARPQRVRAIVLLDSLGAVGDGGQGTMQEVIRGRLPPAVIERLDALAGRGLSPAEEASAALQLIWPGYFADPASAPEPPPLRVDPLVGAPIMEDVNRLLAAGFLERSLPVIDVPSVHVIGTESPIDPDVNRATAALCREALAVELNCGHFPWLEQPGSVTQAIRRLALEATGRGGS